MFAPNAGPRYWTVISDTSTGAVNDWAPALNGHTIIEWNGASDFTPSGIAGGVAGQFFLLKNVSTAFIIHCPHNTGPTAANKTQNTVTSAPTSAAPGGWFLYAHSGTDWKLVGQEQGAWITPAFSAARYTALTGLFTVDAGDEQTYAYWLSGATLFFSVWINTASVSATPATLIIGLPSTFTIAKASVYPTVFAPNGANEMGFAIVAAGGAAVSLARVPAAGAFVVTTNTTYAYFLLAIPVN
jgi:hypothetical protein